MSDPKYTVAVCNYNMADTLEESLRSILDQLEGDERFEVLVIDDGSTDGSQKILDKLEKEYKILRWTEGNNKNIGEARAQANEEAKGEYIITQLDADDKYQPVIQDFVEVYEQIINKTDREFYMDCDISIAPKELLTEINYRDMGYGEDVDLGRRLQAAGKIMGLDHKTAKESIGYDRETVENIRAGLDHAISNFRSGVSLRSFIIYKAKNINIFEHYFQLIFSAILYLIARKRGIHGLPEGYENMKHRKTYEKMPITYYEEYWGFEIERKELSEKARELLFNYQ